MIVFLTANSSFGVRDEGRGGGGGGAERKRKERRENRREMDEPGCLLPEMGTLWSFPGPASRLWVNSVLQFAPASVRTAIG